jgi:hypothetical protein
MGLSVVAMFIAAFGYLPPVPGALLQEAIDVAVILNALRVLTGEAAPAPLTDRAAIGAGLSTSMRSFAPCSTGCAAPPIAWTR